MQLSYWVMSRIWRMGDILSVRKNRTAKCRCRDESNDKHYSIFCQWLLNHQLPAFPANFHSSCSSLSYLTLNDLYKPSSILFQNLLSYLTFPLQTLYSSILLANITIIIILRCSIDTHMNAMFFPSPLNCRKRKIIASLWIAGGVRKVLFRLAQPADRTL
jgi:hypothetical protein